MRLRPAPFAEPRWRRRKAARPCELLEAALKTFADKGYAATRMEDIAHRAGVTKGTVYLYFPSKQAVLEALVKATLLPNLDRVEALLDAHQGPVAPLLTQILETVATRLAESDIIAIPKLIIAEAGNFPDIAAFYRREVIDRGTGLLARLYRAGIASGEFPDLDPQQVAKLIIAPVLIAGIWRVTFARFDAEPFDAAALIRRHAEILTRGLRGLAEDAAGASP